MFLTILQMFLLLLILCLSLLYLYLCYNFNYWKKRGVPYAKPGFILGNLSFVMRKSFTQFFYELKKEHPSDYVGLFFGWKPALVVQTPKLARQILSKDFNHFQNRLSYSSYSYDPLGALNLFTIKDQMWVNMRQELSPLFTSSRLKQLSQLMNENSTELVDRIQREHIDKNETVNLKDLFSMYASDTVGSTVFGIKVSALKHSDSPLWFITKNMVKWTFRRGLELILIFFIPTLSGLLRLQFFSEAATEYIKKLFWDVVKQREESGTSNDKDLVNHLLRLKENLKLPADGSARLADELMLAQVAVFILGSIETSSTTLTYCLHELAHHPEEQEKLYKEINDARQNSGKDILDYDELVQLKYLTACILETLRMHTPVPMLDRICNKTYKLDDKITIERGTPVFTNVMALHYDPEVFPEPDRWRPERMYNVPESDNLNFSFLPFGDGPRFCIGKRYGVIQIRTALAQVLSKYRVVPDPGQQYLEKPDPYSVFLSPTSGGRVKFVLR